MKTTLKLFVAVLMTGMCSLGYGQDYLNAPKANEKVLGNIFVEKGKWTHNDGYWGNKTEWYNALLQEAIMQYPNKVVDIRQMVPSKDDHSDIPWKGPVTGKVVDLGGNPANQTFENLSKAMDKAFRNVREGSRVAIDMVTVSGGVEINREDLKDQVLDALLDNGYKVVAKDYLEKLYEEQQNQQSGIYNDKTTVLENNFSAVGYYINVKVTETSLRVQVVNVSTGEYEGNATITF